MFAATYPQRTEALVMYGTWRPAAGISPPRDIPRYLAEIEQRWGQGVDLPRFAPSRADDPAFKLWWTRLQRRAASPGAACALLVMNYDIDIKDVLPTIRVPTLVLHRAGDRVSHVEGRRYSAARIPGARYVELPGEDHLPFVGDVDAILDKVQ